MYNITTQNTTDPQSIPQYSWFGFLEPQNKEIFTKIDSVCKKFHQDTVEFIFKLKINPKLREHFLQQNQIDIEDLKSLIEDVFFPINQPIKQSKQWVKHSVEQVLKEEWKRKLSQVLHTNNIQDYIKTIDYICSYYKCDYAYFAECIEKINYSNDKIWRFKNTLKRWFIRTIIRNIQNTYKDLDIALFEKIKNTELA